MNNTMNTEPKRASKKIVDPEAKLRKANEQKASDVFSMPKDGKKPKEKIGKSRLHIYLRDDTIREIDERAAEYGFPRSYMIQLIVKNGLKNLVIPPEIKEFIV